MMEFHGIKLIGFSTTTANKLLLTLAVAGALTHDPSRRIVTVTNDKVFEDVPVPYRADRAVAEEISLRVVRDATAPHHVESRAARERLQQRYGVDLESGEPCVFWRLTDNWLELTVRFVTAEHGIRELKDRMTRALLAEFDAHGIDIASATMEISRVAPIEITRRNAQSSDRAAGPGV